MALLGTINLVDQRIEAGKRFVTDLELIAISKALNKTMDKRLYLM